MGRTADATQGGKTETPGPDPAGKSVSNRALAPVRWTGGNFDKHHCQAGNESRTPEGCRTGRNCRRMPPDHTASREWRRPGHLCGETAARLLPELQAEKAKK